MAIARRSGRVAVSPVVGPVVAVVAVVASACTVTGPEPAPRGDVFEFEPGLHVSLAPLTGKADLPNGEFRARPLDTSGYRAIADKFIAAGLDVALTHAKTAYEWPLADSHTVLNRQGTPIRLGSDVYEHTGLDIIRADDAGSAVVRAPTTGTACITDWDGGDSWNDPYGSWSAHHAYGDYSTVVSIWDPVTHHVLQVMHVKPDPAFGRGCMFPVERGQVIGELAEIDIPGGRHVHVNVIDAEQFTLVDPVTVLPAYPDTTAPVIGDVYLLDEQAARHDTLPSGPFDLVVTAHDRDDTSPRNLEIASVAFTATDPQGNVVARLPRCRLADAFAQLATDWTTSASTIRLIDFGSATGQYSGFWPSSDLGNPDRLFRYALTNLRVDESGTCGVVAADRDGQLVVGPEVTALTVTIELWDAHHNLQRSQVTLRREGQDHADPTP